ncbi:MAG: dTDP-4-dehydrorhamnose reductase [Phycisphaerales bacterium]|jgi:dTDP-4-dehydrorhamnose reductase|nr:dTDP-4-dehydrorhamnose reductase [Phycisphaerales bacterium]
MSADAGNHRSILLGHPIVLLGASGMLGRAWRELLERERAAPICPEMTELDLSASNGASCVTPERLASIIDGHRDHARSNAASPTDATATTPIVINAAAYTDVDRAESDEGAARAINALGVARLAAACRAIGATLVHYSTDYVFDGHSSEPYRTDHPRTPINAYGRTKGEGEEAIEQEIAHGLDAILIRTSWLYAPWGRNFVRTIARLAREKNMLRVVDDQRGRPTSAEHLARCSLALLDARARGIFHVTDGGACSWFELARFVVETLGLPCVVEPCTTSEFPRPAPRPAWSVLDLAGTERLLGPMPPWTDNVRDVLARLEHEPD